MSKVLSILFVLLVGTFVVAAQDKTVNLPQSNSTEQTKYSESTPYQPREFVSDDTKKKKQKKSKKNPTDENLNQTVNNSPQNIDNNKNIKIPVFVYDRKGNAVTDLQNSEMKLFIDGQEQEIATFEAVRQPLNLLLILDTSPSIAYKENDLQNVVSKLIAALKPEDKLQIIKFDAELSVLTEPTNDLKVLNKAVKKIKIGGGTSLYDSINRIFQKNISLSNEQQSIILLTDGVDTTSWKASFITSLVEAEKHGNVIFPFYFDSYDYFQKNKPPAPNVPFGSFNVGNSSGISKEEYELGKAFLQDIASLSGGRTFAVKNFAEVKKEDFESALKLINPHYYLSVNSTQTGNTFQRKQIKVRVNRPNLNVSARGSYVIGEN
jgi:VWFA-related protein